MLPPVFRQTGEDGQAVQRQIHFEGGSGTFEVVESVIEFRREVVPADQIAQAEGVGIGEDDLRLNFTSVLKKHASHLPRLKGDGFHFALVWM